MKETQTQIRTSNWETLGWREVLAHWEVKGQTKFKSLKYRAYPQLAQDRFALSERC